MEEFRKYDGGVQPVSDDTEVHVKLCGCGQNIFKGYLGKTAPWFATSNGVYSYRIVKPKLQIVKQKESDNA